MEKEKLDALMEKVSNGTATPEEKLSVLTELNKAADELMTIITKIKEEK